MGFIKTHVINIVPDKGLIVHHILHRPESSNSRGKFPKALITRSGPSVATGTSV